MIVIELALTRNSMQISKIKFRVNAANYRQTSAISSGKKLNGRNNVMSSLKWQRFFSGEILKKQVEKHARAVSKSKLRFKGFDEERIKDRKDPFATEVFQTSLGTPHSSNIGGFSTLSVILLWSFCAKSKRRRRFTAHVSLLPHKRPRESVLEAVRPFWSPRSCV